MSGVRLIAEARRYPAKARLRPVLLTTRRLSLACHVDLVWLLLYGQIYRATVTASLGANTMPAHAGGAVRPKVCSHQYPAAEATSTKPCSEGSSLPLSDAATGSQSETPNPGSAGSRQRGSLQYICLSVGKNSPGA